MKCLLIDNDCYNARKTMKPAGVVVHSTGANNPYLKRYVQPVPRQANYESLLASLGKNKYGNHWNMPGVGKCVHAFIGKQANGVVTTVQTLPYTTPAWGCGAGKNGSYNTNYIQIEICEDNLLDKAYFDAVYKEAIKQIANLCRTYNIPLNNVVSHAEAYKRGYASNHADIDHWLTIYGLTMNDFRGAISKEAYGVESEYFVKVTADELNVRKGPGVNYDVTYVIKDKGVYTIVKTEHNWGKLKSGKGWINLVYAKKVNL